MSSHLQYLKYRAKFNSRKWFEYAGDFPVHVDIELAGKCQLACTMCPYGDGSFDKSMQGMMPIEVAKAAILEAALYGASSIKFNFRGEPGLYKKLPNLVSIAKECGIVEASINTNLTAFTHQQLIELCAAGIDLIIISIDGATKKTYEKIRVKGDWEKLIDNFTFLCGLPNKPRIRVQAVRQEGNLEEIENGLFRNLFEWPGHVELLIQNLREDNKGARRRCPQPWQRLIVAWDGKVFACCSNWNNEFPVGEFPESSLYDIWNKSPLLKDLRQKAKSFSSFPCQHCTIGASYK